MQVVWSKLRKLASDTWALWRSWCRCCRREGLRPTADLLHPQSTCPAVDDAGPAQELLDRNVHRMMPQVIRCFERDELAAAYILLTRLRRKPWTGSEKIVALIIAAYISDDEKAYLEDIFHPELQADIVRLFDIFEVQFKFMQDIGFQLFVHDAQVLKLYKCCTRADLLNLLSI